MYIKLASSALQVDFLKSLTHWGSPLYSAGNYIQYPVINHNGKAHEKEYLCV